MERLSEEKLEIITGYRRKSKQVEWLRSKCIPFHVDRFGKPVVFEENYFKHKRQTTPKSDYVGWNPNPAFR